MVGVHNWLGPIKNIEREICFIIIFIIIINLLF